MKFNQERAKHQPVDPETRHLQLVRGSELERAVEKAFRAMDEGHHGAALKLMPSTEHVAQTEQVAQMPVDNQVFVDNVAHLADHRQRVDQALAEQENQLNPRDMFDAAEVS